MTTANHITISRTGRRSYLQGNTFPIKAAIKAAGGHWDSEAKAWWMSDDVAAHRIASEAASQASAHPAYVAAEGEEFVAVSGNTYPARDALRALGGHWVAAAKTWEVPVSQAAAADAAVASAPAAKPFQHSSCRDCGARPNARGWPRIYRNGVCSDCYSDRD